MRDQGSDIRPVQQSAGQCTQGGAGQEKILLGMMWVVKSIMIG